MKRKNSTGIEGVTLMLANLYLRTFVAASFAKPANDINTETVSSSTPSLANSFVRISRLNLISPSSSVLNRRANIFGRYVSHHIRNKMKMATQEAFMSPGANPCPIVCVFV